MLEILHYWLLNQPDAKVCQDFGAWVESIFSGITGWNITGENHRGIFLCTHQESVLANSFIEFLDLQACNSHMRLLQGGECKDLNPFALIGLLSMTVTKAKAPKVKACSFSWFTGGDTVCLVDLAAFEEAPQPADFFQSDGWFDVKHRKFNTDATVQGLRGFMHQWPNQHLPVSPIRVAFANSRHPATKSRRSAASKRRSKAGEDGDFSGSSGSLSSEPSSDEEGGGRSSEKASGTKRGPGDARKRSRAGKKERRAAERAHDPTRWLAWTRLVHQAAGVSSAAPRTAPPTLVTVDYQAKYIQGLLTDLEKTRGQQKCPKDLDARIDTMKSLLQGPAGNIGTKLALMRGVQVSEPLPSAAVQVGGLHRDVIEGFDPDGLTLQDQVSIAVAIMKNLRNLSARAHYLDVLDEMQLVSAPPPPPPPPVMVRRSPTPPLPEVSPAVLAACQGYLGGLRYLCEQFKAVISGLPIPVTAEPDIEVEGRAAVPRPPKPPPSRNMACTYDSTPSEFPVVLQGLLSEIKPSFKHGHEIFRLVSESFCHCDFLVWLFLKRMGKIVGKQSDAIERKAVAVLQHMTETTLPIVRVAGYDYLNSGGLFDPVENKFQPLALCSSFIGAATSLTEQFDDLVTNIQEQNRCSPALAQRLAFNQLIEKSDHFKEWNLKMTKEVDVTAFYRSRDLNSTPGPVMVAQFPPSDAALQALVVPHGFDGVRPVDMEGDYIMLHAPPIEDFFRPLDPSRMSVLLHASEGGLATKLPRAV